MIPEIVFKIGLAVVQLIAVVAVGYGLGLYLHTQRRRRGVTFLVGAYVLLLVQLISIIVLSNLGLIAS